MEAVDRPGEPGRREIRPRRIDEDDASLAYDASAHRSVDRGRPLS